MYLSGLNLNIPFSETSPLPAIVHTHTRTGTHTLCRVPLPLWTPVGGITGNEQSVCAPFLSPPQPVSSWRVGLCPIPIFLLAHDTARTRCSVNTHGTTKAGITALTEGGMVEASSPPPISQARSG